MTTRKVTMCRKCGRHARHDKEPVAFFNITVVREDINSSTKVNYDTQLCESCTELWWEWLRGITP